MTRLEVLKAEKEQIKGLRCLSFGLIDKCIEWYDKEIEAIVIHGADNKFYGQQADRNEFYNWDAPIRHKADGEYISKDKMLMFLNDMRYGIAPDETVADDDERREREAQVDVLDDLMEVVEQMPTVAIPSAEPRYCDRNICLRNEYNGIGCDECEVGNPCLYCKHEFEPQESEEV